MRRGVALAVYSKYRPAFRARNIVFVHVVDVFSHQHAVLVFHQKIVRRIGLAPSSASNAAISRTCSAANREFFPAAQVVRGSQMRRDEIRSQDAWQKRLRSPSGSTDTSPAAGAPGIPSILPRFVVVVTESKTRGRRESTRDFSSHFKDGVKFRCPRDESRRIFQIHPKFLKILPGPF